MIKLKGIKCNKCGDIIYSRCTHDFNSCSCSACAVDGGLEYMGILGKIEDFSVVDVELDFDSIETVKRALYDDWNQNKNLYGRITKTNLKK